MPNTIDLSGHRCDRWLVLSRAANLYGRVTAWHCRCDCGTERVVSAANLRSGASGSCGCLHRERSTARNRGADVTYETAHGRLARKRGPAAAHPCVDCGWPADDWSLRKRAPGVKTGVRWDGNPCTYSPDPMDYEPRCRSCHAKYDGLGAHLPAGGPTRIVQPRVSDDVLVDSRTPGN